MDRPGKSLLVISQATSDRRNLASELVSAGLMVMEADGTDDALRLFEDRRPSLLCIHHSACGAFDGLELVRRIRTGDPVVPIILASERRSEELLLQALRAGANDFVPWRPPLQQLLDRILATVELSARTTYAAAGRQAGDGLRGNADLVGQSPEVHALRRQIAAAARVVSNVLITGETGTGKELVAELIHQNSRRHTGPFVPVSCAAVPEALFEGEMFGVVRGAFTGAYATREGKLKQADGGTLFLDEIGEMPVHVQAKLLRATERKEVQRLGDHRTSRVDVRIIAATNQDLEEMVGRQKFRQDLFFRLNVLRIALPPLRERSSDIPQLAEHFLREIAVQVGQPKCSLDKETLRLLFRYAWPGNVRELRNALEATIARASACVLGREDLPPDLRHRLDQVEGFGQTEKDRLLSILDAVSWDKSKAARQLRWSRATLYRKLARYSILKSTAVRLNS